MGTPPPKIQQKKIRLVKKTRWEAVFREIKINEEQDPNDLNTRISKALMNNTPTKSLYHKPQKGWWNNNLHKQKAELDQTLSNTSTTHKEKAIKINQWKSTCKRTKREYQTKQLSKIIPTSCWRAIKALEYTPKQTIKKINGKTEFNDICDEV